MNIPYGYCHCGCGEKTMIAKMTRTARGYKKGEPIRFIHGHNSSLRKGEIHPCWTGGRIKTSTGYININNPTHNRSDKIGYVKEHILIAEKVFGGPLPKGAVVHHIDGIRDNNARNNLVICQDNTYHLYLHKRTRAFESCGHAKWPKCTYCKRYDPPHKLHISKKFAYHRECHNEYERERRQRRTA